MSLPTPTIAHEGNPDTTPDLVVSGTLDGNAFVSFAPVITPERDLPAPITSPGWRASPNVAVKYVFSGFGYGTDTSNGTSQQTRSAFAGGTFIPCAGSVLEYSQKDNIFCYGCVVSPRQATNSHLIDDHLSTPTTQVFQDFYNEDFYDLLGRDWSGYLAPPTASAIATVFISAKASIHTVANGAPFSGVAVGVPPDATNEDFTGVVDVYDWGTHTEYIMIYDHQPLSAVGTILDSESRSAPVADEVFGLAVLYSISGGTFTYSGGLTMSGNVTLPYNGTDARTALVNLPPSSTSGVDDYVTWKNVMGWVAWQT